MSESVSPLVPLRRQGLADQVHALLLQRILRGEYGPGDRLVETRIAVELGVSQGTVREALRKLEAMRFIDVRLNAGARVRESSSEEMEQVIPVRIALEDLAAELAGDRLGARADEMEAALARMERAAAAGDVGAAVAANTAFHRVVVAAAENDVLLQAWESMTVEARTLVAILAADVDLEDVAARHRPLLDALRTGPLDHFRELLREHHLEYAADHPARARSRSGRDGP